MLNEILGRQMKKAQDATSGLPNCLVDNAILTPLLESSASVDLLNPSLSRFGSLELLNKSCINSEKTRNDPVSDDEKCESVLNENNIDACPSRLTSKIEEEKKKNSDFDLLIENEVVHSKQNQHAPIQEQSKLQQTTLQHHMLRNILQRKTELVDPEVRSVINDHSTNENLKHNKSSRCSKDILGNINEILMNTTKKYGGAINNNNNFDSSNRNIDTKIENHSVAADLRNYHDKVTFASNESVVSNLGRSVGEIMKTIGKFSDIKIEFDPCKISTVTDNSFCNLSTEFNIGSGFNKSSLDAIPTSGSSNSFKHLPFSEQNENTKFFNNSQSHLINNLVTKREADDFIPNNSVVVSPRSDPESIGSQNNSDINELMIANTSEGQSQELAEDASILLNKQNGTLKAVVLDMKRARVENIVTSMQTTPPSHLQLHLQVNGCKKRKLYQPQQHAIERYGTAASDLNFGINMHTLILEEEEEGQDKESPQVYQKRVQKNALKSQLRTMQEQLAEMQQKYVLLCSRMEQESEYQEVDDALSDGVVHDSATSSAVSPTHVAIQSPFSTSGSAHPRKSKKIKSVGPSIASTPPILTEFMNKMITRTQSPFIEQSHLQHSSNHKSSLLNKTNYSCPSPITHPAISNAAAMYLGQHFLLEHEVRIAKEIVEQNERQQQKNIPQQPIDDIGQKKNDQSVIEDGFLTNVQFGVEKQLFKKQEANQEQQKKFHHRQQDDVQQHHPHLKQKQQHDKQHQQPQQQDETQPQQQQQQQIQQHEHQKQSEEEQQTPQQQQEHHNHQQQQQNQQHQRRQQRQKQPQQQLQIPLTQQQHQKNHIELQQRQHSQQQQFRHHTADICPHSSQGTDSIGYHLLDLNAQQRSQNPHQKHSSIKSEISEKINMLRSHSSSTMRISGSDLEGLAEILKSEITTSLSSLVDTIVTRFVHQRRLFNKQSQSVASAADQLSKDLMMASQILERKSPRMKGIHQTSSCTVPIVSTSLVNSSVRDIVNSPSGTLFQAPKASMTSVAAVSLYNSIGIVGNGNGPHLNAINPFYTADTTDQHLEQNEALSLVITPKKKRHKVTDTRITPRTVSRLLAQDNGQGNIFNSSDSNNIQIPSTHQNFFLNQKSLLSSSTMSVTLTSPTTSKCSSPRVLYPPPGPSIMSVSLPSTVAIPNPSLHESQVFSPFSPYYNSHQGVQTNPQLPAAQTHHKKLSPSPLDFGGLLENSDSTPTHPPAKSHPSLLTAAHHGKSPDYSPLRVPVEVQDRSSECNSIDIQFDGIQPTISFLKQQILKPDSILPLHSSTLTPMHLRKAKLMFFWVRYPSSAVLKMYFPDIKFNKNNTAQLVKWFSNFREFYYIQMEKYARQAVTEGLKSCEELHVGSESELYRVLNLHYNRNNHIEVPPNFRFVVEQTLREFFRAIKGGKDTEQSWKKSIYKIISRMDDPVPEYFKSPNFLEQLE